jgi:hypothetical protein
MELVEGLEWRIVFYSRDHTGFHSFDRIFFVSFSIRADCCEDVWPWALSPLLLVYTVFYVVNSPIDHS